MLGNRNQQGLNEQQIDACIKNWGLLCGDNPRIMNTDQAHVWGSRTRFNEDRNVVYLGADAFPGDVPISANARMSMLACLSHELAHAERLEAGYARPYTGPDSFLDEAETSIRASFISVLSRRDREDLVEDAKDRLEDWLAEYRKERQDEDRT